MRVGPSPLTRLRVLSFNIWRSGGRSLEATIAVIRGADVIGLQECRADTAAQIAQTLGLVCVHDDQGHAILSRFPIVDVIGSTADPWGGFGATIALGPEARVHLFDAHLHYTDYGPYALRAGRSVAEVLEQERSVRMPGLFELLDRMAPYLEPGASEPVFLVGDFNAPSHLDYDGIDWPASVLCEARGLVDAFRIAHPVVPRYPFAFDDHGITWTPLVSEEPHGAFDRIDFVYHRALANVAVESVVVLDERNSVTPWPSDHRAVLATFAIG